MGREFKATLEEVKMHFKHVDNDEDWMSSLCNLRNQFQQYKGKAMEICLLVLSDGFKSSQNNLFLADGWNTATFIDSMLENLGSLHSDTDSGALVYQQLSFIEGKLKMFGMFAKIAQASFRSRKRFEECIAQTRTWTNCISCIVCLYWIDERDEQLESAMGAMIPDLMQKYMPYTHRVIALYINMLKATTTRHQKVPSVALASLVVNYVDFLLEHLVLMHADDTENLSEGMIFLLSFVMDLPDENSEEKREILLPQFYDAINEIPSVICFPESKLSGFLCKIDRIKVGVR